MGVVVILVLYFVISSSIIRRRRELGIQKAIGFTTFQLMNQIAFGFLPPIIMGVVIGNILGVYLINPLMTLGMTPLGVMSADFIINPSLIAALGSGIVLASYITAIFVTYRIRKISAYSLVTE